MAPMNAILAVALLAVGGVDARHKNKLSYSRYLSPDCNGHPIGGKISHLKLDKEGKSDCEGIAGSGIRLHKAQKDKYNHWIDNVNTGQDQCYATLYNGYGCNAQNKVADISVPKDFQQCNPLGQSLGSLQFHCEPNFAYHGAIDVREENLTVTSYSIANDGKASPSVYTTLINVTSHMYPDPTELPILLHSRGLSPDVLDQMTMEPHHIDARAEPTQKASLEPRKKKGKKNEVGVWLKHPWTGSDLCFKCWTKKEMDFGKFKCRSGDGDKYAIDCGPKPDPSPPVVTSMSTAVRVVNVFFTATDQFSHLPTPGAKLEERSPHKAVILQNPYMPSRPVCADAEWENSGKAKAEVRIQHVKPFHKCNKKHPLDINIAVPQSTVHAAVTLTGATIISNYHPTWAGVVPAATSVVPVPVNQIVDLPTGLTPFPVPVSYVFHPIPAPPRPT